MRRLLPANACLLPLFALPFFLLCLDAPVRAHEGHGGPSGGYKFTENKGQWHENARFRVRLPAGDLWLENNRLTCLLLDPAQIAALHPTPDLPDLPGSLDAHVYRVNFPGANPNPQLTPFGQKDMPEHYLLGADESRWASDVRSYRGVKYAQLWDGIDLEFYEYGGRLKYDFIVGAGADPQTVRMNYEGAESLELTDDGRLIVHTSVRDVEEFIPKAYQMIDGEEVRVACAFRMLDETTVGFAAPEGYDPAYPLVIDPTLVYATYTGATTDNWGFTATYDDAGDMYSGGIVSGAGYPVTPGAVQIGYGGGIGFPTVQTEFSLWYDMDMGLIKYNTTTGAAVWATYIGGRHNEQPHSIIANANNELYILGTTRSDDYPTTPNAYDRALNGTYRNDGFGDIDIVVTKLNAAGAAFLGSTYVGGTGWDGVNANIHYPGGPASPLEYNPLYYFYADDARGEIILDPNGSDCYIVSCTRSTGAGAGKFPTSPGAIKSTVGGEQDACVFKMDGALSTLTWSTLLGGGEWDAGYAMKIASDRSLYVVGGTDSDDLPTTPGALNPAAGGGLADGFVFHLDNTGTAVLEGSYIGTPEYDQTYMIDLDASDNVYIAGQTLGNYPVQNAGYVVANGKQYITKLTPNLATIDFSTRFGNLVENRPVPDITFTAFLVDVCENIYVSGWGGRGLQAPSPNVPYSGSTNGMQVTPNAYTSVTDDNDFYLMVLAPNAANLKYATFFGATNSDDHVDGGTSRFDKDGIVYHSVCGSCGNETQDIPTTPNAHSRTDNSTNCNNAAFKFDFDILPVVKADFAFDNTVCVAPVDVAFTNTSTGATNYRWDFGDGGTSSDANPTHTFNQPGEYKVRLIANDPSVCSFVQDTIEKTLYVYVPTPALPVVTTSPCSTEVTFANNTTDGVTHFWDFGDGTTSTAFEPPTKVYSTPGFYTITYKVNTQADCVDSLLQVFNVGVNPVGDFDVAPETCNPTVNFTNNSLHKSIGYEWEFGDGATSTAENPAHTYAGPGVYDVTLTVDPTLSCADQITKQVEVFAPSEGGAVGAGQTICAGATPAQLALTGHLGRVLRWERSVSGGPWQTINHTGTIFQPPALNQTTRFRAVVQNEICAPAESQPVEIEVTAPPVAGTVSGGGSVCEGAAVAPLTLSGHSGNIQWQASNDNFQNDVRDLPGETGTQLSPGALTADVCFRAVVSVGGGCPDAVAQPACFVVSPRTLPGAVLQDQTVCSGATNLTLSLASSQGGVLGWQSSTNNFASSTPINYTGKQLNVAGPVTADVCYRARVKSGVCPEANSTPACFTVDAPTIPGTLTGAATVCEGAANRTFELNGHNGTVLRWEVSTDNFSFNIQTINHTQRIYTRTTPITQDICLRAVVKNGACGERFSNPVCVVVNRPTQPGVVAGPQTVCSGATNVGLSLSGAVVGQIVGWQRSTNDFGSFTNIAFQGETYTAPGPLTQETCYRARVKNGVCPEETSAEWCVQVDDQTAGGNISGGTTVCRGAENLPLQLSGANGGVVRWEASADNFSAFIQTINHTGTQYVVPGPVTGPVCYRAVVKNGVCAEAPAQPACFAVDQPSNGGVVAGAGTVCRGATNVPLTLTGERGTVVRWEYSDDNFITDVRPINFTGENYVVAQALVQPYCYRAVVKNGVCGEAFSQPSCFVIDEPPVAGTLNQPPPICSGAAPDPLQVSGFEEQVKGWEVSANNGATWQPAGSANPVFAPGALTANRCFRAIVGRGVCPDTRTPRTCIDVSPPTDAGFISSPQTICEGNAAQDLMLVEFEGAILGWEVSDETQTGWTALPQSGQFLSTGPLTETTCYRAQVQSGVCAPAFTAPVCITVEAIALQSEVVGGTALCEGTPAPVLNIRNVSGRIVQWERRDAGGVWTRIPHNGVSYAPGALNRTTCYRAVIDRGVCGVQTATPTCIEVTPRTIPGIIFGETRACASEGTLLTLSENKGAILRWERSTNCPDGPWVAVDNQANTQFAGPMTQTTCYRAVVQSGACPAEATQPITLNLSPPMKANVSYINPPRCNGDQDMKMGIDISGGFIPYTYQWAHGPQTEDLFGGGAGGYTITVTDAIGCQAVFNFTVPEPDPVKIELNEIREPACSGESTGSIGVDVSGGNPGYNYFWSSDARQSFNTEDIANVPAGVYRLSVTDQKGCRATMPFRLTEPSPLSASVTTARNANCLFDAELAGAGGVPPYTYLWSAGATGPSVTDLPAGQYLGKVTDANGCAAETTFRIDANPIRLIVNTLQHVKCFGGKDGAIGITADGAQPPYNYLWVKAGTGEQWSVQDLSGLSAGNYTLNIQSADGCAFDTTFTLNGPSAPLEILLLDQRDPLCAGDANGRISVAADGGTPTYTYKWNTGASGKTLENAPAGQYAVTATDANGCVAIKDYRLEAPESLRNLSADIQPPKCFGGADGGIAPDISGGTPPYAFVWKTGALNENLSDAPAGTYWLNVADANGCKRTFWFDLPNPEPLRAEWTAIQPESCDGAANGGATVAVSGGTEPYVYAWSDGSGNRDLRGVSAGAYDLLVADANGCTTTLTVDIPQGEVTAEVVFARPPQCAGADDGYIFVRANDGGQTFQWYRDNRLLNYSGPFAFGLKSGAYRIVVSGASGCRAETEYDLQGPPQINLTTTVRNASCADARDGRIDVSVAGGAPSYAYNWLDGFTQPSRTQLTSGVYMLQITDANGCRATAAAFVSAPPRLELRLTTRISLLCKGEQTGELAVKASGGTPPYAYQWNDGATGPARQGLAAGRYAVTATDANGCANVLDGIVLEEPDAPIAITLNFAETESCFGAEDGALGIDVSGGTEPYTYQWSVGAGGENQTGLGKGVFSVTATDANGCSASATFDVSGPDAPLELTTAFVQDASCSGAADGAISLQPTGGLPPYDFRWSHGAQTADVGGLQAGTYSVVMTDAGGCAYTRTYVVEEPQPLMISAQTAAAGCEADGRVELNISGGTGPYAARWSNGAEGPVLGDAAPGPYAVVVTDANGCAQTGFFVVEETPELTVELDEARDATCASADDGLIRVRVTGGTQPFAYDWGADGGTATNSGLAPGQYTVLVRDAAGCAASLTHTITAPPRLVASIGAAVDAGCGSQGAAGLNVSGGTAPYAYRWSNGATTKALQNVGAGTYRVTVTDANGCQTTAQTVIAAREGIELKLLSKTNPNCPGGADGEIAFEATGGTAPYTLIWLNGRVGAAQSGLAAGTYRVLVFGAGGCRADAVITLTDPAPVVVSAGQIGGATCNAGGFISVDVSGGTAPYDYLWSNGKRGATALGLSAGPHSVTVTDANGCAAEAAFVVPGAAPKTARLFAPEGPFCPDAEPFALHAEPGGGTFSGPGVAEDGRFDPGAAGPGSHLVQYEKRLNGCVYSGEIVLTILPEIALQITSVPPTCAGCQNGFLFASASGAFPLLYRLDGGQYQQSPLFAGLAPGVYDLTVRDANGCETTQTVEVGARDARATSSAPSAKARIALYPNPASDRATVSYALPEAGARLVVRDLAGKSVAELALPGTSGEAVLETAEWPSGVYVCVFESLDGRVHGKEKLVVVK